MSTAVLPQDAERELLASFQRTDHAADLLQRTSSFCASYKARGAVIDPVESKNLLSDLSRLPRAMLIPHEKALIDAEVVRDRTELTAILTGLNPTGEIAAWTFPHSAQPKELVSCGIKFNPKSAPQMLSEKSPERSWVWEKYLPSGGLVLLAGAPKAGKSTLAYHLIKAVIEGASFLGFKVQKCPVLILAVEEHREDITDRLLALGLSGAEDLHIHCAPLRSSPVELEGIKRFIQAQGVGLVVIDTLARFWNVREENAAAEVGAQMDPLLDLARSTGCGVLLIHHARKSEGQDGTEIRGSGDLLAAADAGLVLKPNRGSDTQRVLLAYSRFPTPRELVVSLENGRYVVLGTTRYVRHEEQRKQVLDVIGLDFQEANTIARGADMPAGTCRTVLAELFEDGLIERQGEGTKNKAYSYALKSQNDSAQKELLGVRNNPEPLAPPEPLKENPLIDVIQHVFGEVTVQ